MTELEQVTNIISPIFIKITTGVILTGIAAILNGQRITRKQARQGRKDLHEKINPFIKILTKLVATHNCIHPNNKIED